MEWLYFTLIEVDGGLDLYDEKYEVRLGQIFQSRSEADQYLEDNAISGSIR